MRTTPGVERLAAVCGCLEQLGVSSSFALDPSITRGLDYYTGIVFETFLSDLPAIGSVCSGGRYNDLASLYTQAEPARASEPPSASTGSWQPWRSWGFWHPGPPPPGCSSSAPTRSCSGTTTEKPRPSAPPESPRRCFPEPRKLAAQFAYAEKKGIPLGLVPAERRPPPDWSR